MQNKTIKDKRIKIKPCQALKSQYSEPSIQVHIHH